jgi:integrase
MLRLKRHEIGLGPLSLVGLAEAREEADRWRRMVLAGRDPKEAKGAQRAQAALAAAEAQTFKQCSDAYIAAHRESWRNPKHRAQWEMTMRVYVEPVIGALAVGDVKVGNVMQILEPMWKTKTETAARIRGRIEAVLDWAKARGYRDGDNPARLRGHLENLLPARVKVQKVEHHPALPYDDLPAFMAALRGQGGTAARALELVILTAARTSEVIGAGHAEIKGAVWTIPPDRMKAAREHRVPLSSRVVEIIAAKKRENGGEGYIFPGAAEGQPLSNMSLLAVLKRMGRSDITTHGFRSTFRDWTAERTGFPQHVAEMALAHALDSKVEAAYRRGDLIEKRVKLMEAWSAYCASGKPARGEVVPMQRHG